MNVDIDKSGVFVRAYEIVFKPPFKFGFLSGLIDSNLHNHTIFSQTALISLYKSHLQIKMRQKVW